MNALAPVLLALVAILTPQEAAAMIEPDGLSALLPDAQERRRYLATLARMSRHPVTPGKLAQRARLKHRAAQVRAALRADPRFTRIREPVQGPERYALRPERHAPRRAEA